MNKNFQLFSYSVILLIAMFFTMPLKAQVTIGAQKDPDKNALLDLKQDNTDNSSTKGLLLPRVKLNSTGEATPMTDPVEKGMVVYNTESAGDVTPGIYYNDGTKWVGTQDKKWFYMPAFNLPVTTKTNGLKCDLYAEYKRQFTKSDNAQFFSSDAGATTVQPIYAADQLEYYVTAFNTTSFLTITGVDASGVMTYNVTSLNIPEGSYINVVFVVK